MQKNRVVLPIMTLVLSISAMANSLSAQGEDTIRVTNLRCEYHTDPLGVDSVKPRLSWALESDVRGQRQTAYQVLVATSMDKLAEDKGDLWDSGKVASDQSSQIVYKGRELKSRMVCYWKLRVWNKAGVRSSWSKSGMWTMGLLSAADWKAEWIASADNPVHHTSENVSNFKGHPQRGSLLLTPARHLRRAFSTDSKPVRAMLYATSLGVHTVEINGQRIGDWFLAPGWTSYHKRLNYLSYDVTEHIAEGSNALAVTIADGFYAGYCAYGLLTDQPGLDPNIKGRYYYGKIPAVLVQLELEYADGRREFVVSDLSWKSAIGPIKEADILMGETYDARAELTGWSRADYDDSRWKTAVAHPGTKASLEPHPGMSVRTIEEIKPVSMKEHRPGVWIFDLGQNISGVVRLKVKGKAGDQVVIRYAEMLHADGRMSVENLRCARAVDSYTLKGDSGGEKWTPAFTYHGFQYVEISGYPGQPSKDSITGIVIHSDTPMVGSFECSDPMLNRLYKNIVWTQRGNFFDIPTDCPQRDERMGWTGDAQIYARAASYNADISAFYTKWLRDLNDDQWEHGPYPNFAPTPFIRPNMHFAAAWGDAGIICPWTIWRVYGDTRPIEEHWNKMEKYMNFRLERDPKLVGTRQGDCGFGDWLALHKPKTPIQYIDLAYHAHTAALMTEMADAIGKADRAVYYQKHAGKLREQFAKLHVLPDGKLKIANQSTYAIALFFDLIPEGLKKKAVDELARLIRDNGNKMSTGFLGTRPLLPVLSAHGYHDLAGILIQQKEYPSWGYEVENGATTIWERWNGYIKGKGVHDPGMNSFSHYAFGAVCEWMFAELGGIDLLEPGYKRIKIAPRPTGTITQCAVSTETPHGKLACSWKLLGGRFSATFTIPHNTEAVVTLPVTGDEAGPQILGSGTYTITGKYLSEIGWPRSVQEEIGMKLRTSPTIKKKKIK